MHTINYNHSIVLEGAVQGIRNVTLGSEKAPGAPAQQPLLDKRPRETEPTDIVNANQLPAQPPSKKSRVGESEVSAPATDSAPMSALATDSVSASATDSATDAGLSATQVSPEQLGGAHHVVHDEGLVSAASVAGMVEHHN